MPDCPCCSHPLIRQFHNHQVAWFCRHCWQEMPVLEAEIAKQPCFSQDADLSTSKTEDASIAVG